MRLILEILCRYFFSFNSRIWFSGKIYVAITYMHHIQINLNTIMRMVVLKAVTYRLFHLYSSRLLPKSITCLPSWQWNHPEYYGNMSHMGLSNIHTAANVLKKRHVHLMEYYVFVHSYLSPSSKSTLADRSICKEQEGMIPNSHSLQILSCRVHNISIGMANHYEFWWFGASLLTWFNWDQDMN